jgi:hypothetical protein
MAAQVRASGRTVLAESRFLTVTGMSPAPRTIMTAVASSLTPPHNA